MSLKGKKVLVGVVTLLVVIEACTLFLMYKSLNEKENNLDTVDLKETIDKDVFAIMLEQTDGTYIEGDTWPVDGYVYSETMSGCMDENGNKLEGVLSYDNTTNIATVDTPSTSYCYLYFEKASCTVSLTNLLPNNNFENTGWSGCTYSSTYKKYGNYSCTIIGTSSIPEFSIYPSADITLDNTHIYYSRVEVYTDIAAGSFQTYWPIAEPSMGTVGITETGKWKVHGVVSGRTEFSSGTHALRFDYNNNYQNITAYYDGGMLVDLTASFGSGNEPSVEWLNENLEYIETTGNFSFKPVKDAPNCP